MPYVNWNADNRQVNVNWYDVRNANPRNGLRQKFQHSEPRLCRGVLCLCGEILDPPVRHFGRFNNEHCNTQVRLFLDDVELVFGADEMFEYLKRGTHIFKYHYFLGLSGECSANDVTHCVEYDFFNLRVNP